jgi:hypothetical protein
MEKVSLTYSLRGASLVSIFTPMSLAVLLIRVYSTGWHTVAGGGGITPNLRLYLQRSGRNKCGDYEKLGTSFH